MAMWKYWLLIKASQFGIEHKETYVVSSFVFHLLSRALASKLGSALSLGVIFFLNILNIFALTHTQEREREIERERD